MNACDCVRASHEHGTRTRYIVHQCRCDACRAGNRVAVQERRRQQLYGRHHLVDAEPARQHARALMAQGMGWKKVIEAAGLPISTGSRLLYGRKSPGDPEYRPPARQVHRDTAAAILAVTFELRDGACVPAIGSRRRLQALGAIGWSQNRMAARLGMGVQNFNAMLRRDHVVKATADAVRALYDELWDTPPVPANRFEQGGITRALKHAAAEGWAPPMAWDDETIDDPTAEPAGTGTMTATTEDRAEELIELVRTGESTEAAAVRCGWASWSNAERVLRRAGHADIVSEANRLDARSRDGRKERVA